MNNPPTALVNLEEYREVKNLTPAARACEQTSSAPRAAGLALGYTLSPTAWPDI